MFLVVKEKLFVTGSRHFYVIIAAVLSAPLVITTIIVVLMLVHRRRWHDWRKQALAKEALSAVDVQRTHPALTSQVLQQSLLQPADSRPELNPAMCVLHTNVI